MEVAGGVTQLVFENGARCITQAEHAEFVNGLGQAIHHFFHLAMRARVGKLVLHDIGTHDFHQIAGGTEGVVGQMQPVVKQGVGQEKDVVFTGERKVVDALGVPA